MSAAGRDAALEIMRFPFGKYSGTAITNVPKSYLRWAKENMTSLRPDQLAAIGELLAEYERKSSKARSGKATREVPVETLEELMDALHFYAQAGPVAFDSDSGDTAKNVLAKLREKELAA